jgi:N-acetyl-beta-hexosaminidase
MKLIIALLTCCSITAFAQQSRIFPQPNKITETTGDFVFNGTLTVQNNPVFMEVAPYLQQLFAAEKGVSLIPSTTNFSVSVRSNLLIKAEGYQLTVGSEGIVIEYNDRNGLLYAFQSLQQWMTTVSYTHLRAHETEL